MKKTALVLGGAANVWADAEKALAMFDPDAVLAVNDMIALWPGRISHACTLHGERLLAWQQQRSEAKFNRDYKTIYFDKPRGKRKAGEPKIDRQVDYRWPHIDSGSSGLYAVKILLDLGFDRIVLAGVPMSPRAGHVSRGMDWNAAVNFRGAWASAIPHIHKTVRSMSGWTRETLGLPTSAWLAE